MTTKGNFHELYVATEEEVTTIISRVHAAKERYVVLIIPKNALLLQSTINLRLLSRESKKQQKEIVIITQDEFGLKLAERLGIHAESLSVWQKEMSSQDNISQDTFEVAQDEVIKADVSKEKKIGSSAYYNDETEIENRKNKTFSDIQIDKKIKNNINKKSEIVIDTNSSETVKSDSGQINSLIGKKVVKADFSEKPQEIIDDSNKKNTYREEIFKQSFLKKEYEEVEDEKLAYKKAQKEKKPKIFSKIKNLSKHSDKITFQEKSDKLKPRIKNVKVKSPYKKIVFLSVCIIFFILFITTFPYSTITLKISDFVVSDEVTITAGIDELEMDSERRTIVARKIEKDITKEIFVTPTGKRNSTPQKAKGTITIYNEFSSKPQPLVKTTRFLSEDGVLFRLAKNVVVPGVKNKGDEKIPGKIDVLVIADKTGKASNIKPTKFSIPGFKGSPKASKIYAVSEDDMSGGSSGNENYAMVTEKDIANAKKEAEKDIDKYVLNEVKKILKPDVEVLLKNAMKTNITRSEANSVVGSSVKKMSYFVTTHVIAIVINENDVEKIAKYALKQKKPKFKENDMKFKYDFEKVEANFDNGELIITLNASAKDEGIIDEKEFKKDVANKTHEEILKIIKEKYPIIKDITVSPTPSFMSDRISPRTWMTKIIKN